VVVTGGRVPALPEAMPGATVSAGAAPGRPLRKSLAAAPCRRHVAGPACPRPPRTAPV